MLKVKLPNRSRLQTYVNDLKDIFKKNIYEISINATTKLLVDQHLSPNKHKINLKLIESNSKIQNTH